MFVRTNEMRRRLPPGPRGRTGGFASNRLGPLGWRALVAGVGEAKHGIEEHGQESEAEAVTCAFSEVLGDLNIDHDDNDDTDERDNQEDDPPERLARHTEEQNEVVQGNETAPSGPTRLLKYLPNAGDHRDHDG